MLEFSVHQIPTALRFCAGSRQRLNCNPIVARAPFWRKGRNGPDEVIAVKVNPALVHGAREQLEACKQQDSCPNDFVKEMAAEHYVSWSCEVGATSRTSVVGATLGSVGRLGATHPPRNSGGRNSSSNQARR